MTDTAILLRASVEAQAKVQDLLDAGEAILKHGNRLFNDVHDKDAFYEVVLANVCATKAITAFFRIVEAYDDE